MSLGFFLHAPGDAEPLGEPVEIVEVPEGGPPEGCSENNEEEAQGAEQEAQGAEQEPQAKDDPQDAKNDEIELGNNGELTRCCFQMRKSEMPSWGGAGQPEQGREK